MAPPSFPTDFMSKEAKQVNEAPSTVPDKLTFNFYLPHEQVAKGKKVSHAALASFAETQVQSAQHCLQEASRSM